MGRRQERQESRGPARTAKAGFGQVVLVCGKCAKRQGVDRKRLGRALKRAAGAQESGSETRSRSGDRPAARTVKVARKVKVVETGCLGPCPKRMLAVATADSLARGRIVLLDPALDALGPQALRLDAPAPPVPPPPGADG